RVTVEYDVGALADAVAIRLRFSQPLAAGALGGLTVTGKDGELALPAPEVFLESGAISSRIAASWLVRSGDIVRVTLRNAPAAANVQELWGACFANPNTGIAGSLAAGIVPGARAPRLVFSGYFGGSGQDNISGVAISTTFNVIVAGWTSSFDLPASGVRRS